MNKMNKVVKVSYPKMNINSCSKLLLLLITQAIHGLDQSSVDVCKGNDVDMHWNVSEEENKISKLEWYFNNKIICFSHPVNSFTVSPPYQGRIERIGRTAIRLRTVSLNDEGTYALYPLIAWSTSENIMKIVLHVLVPPTDNCICKMGLPPDFRCEILVSGCGRPKVSLVFKENQALEGLGEGNWITKSTLQGGEILGCLEGEAMKCVNDSRRFCTNVRLPREDDKRSSDDGRTPHTDSEATTVFRERGHGSNDLQQFKQIGLAILTLISVLILGCLIITMVTLMMCCRMRKTRKALDPRNRNEEGMPLKRHIHSEIEMELQPHNIKSKIERTILMNEEIQSQICPVIIDDQRLEETTPMKEPKNNSETEIELKSLENLYLYKIRGEAQMPDHLQSQVGNKDAETTFYALCMICFVKKRSVLFIPCSHIVTCAECSFAVKECPVCRVAITFMINMGFD